VDLNKRNLLAFFYTQTFDSAFYRTLSQGSLGFLLSLLFFQVKDPDAHDFFLLFIVKIFLKNGAIMLLHWNQEKLTILAIQFIILYT